MKRLIAVFVLCAAAQSAFGNTKRVELPEDVTALMTLMVFEDGPGARVVVIWPNAVRPTEDQMDLFLLLGLSSLRAFLAEERWCMSGFTLGERKDSAGQGFEVEARCK